MNAYKVSKEKNMRKTKEHPKNIQSKLSGV